MKKKMVTMLMLGAMAVMTACGSSDKNVDTAAADEVSDDIDLDDLDENVTIMTSTDGEGNTTTTIIRNDDLDKKDDGIIGVDDVKFDERDLAVEGGSTYETKTYYGYETKYWSHLFDANSTYELSPETSCSHVFGHVLRHDSLDLDRTYDNYYDDENDIQYRNYSDEGKLIKRKMNDTYYNQGKHLTESYKEIFELPWTLESETDDEYIFTLSEDADFSDLFDKYEIINDKGDPMMNFKASYVYGKDGSKLHSINLEFNFDKEDEYGNPYTPSFKFSLTASKFGNTIVEIPEDVINNAVEEE